MHEGKGLGYMRIPIQDIDSSSVFGFWVKPMIRNEEHALIRYEVFKPVAEKSNRIYDISKFYIQKTIDVMKSHNQKKIFLNLSNQCYSRKSIINELKRKLKAMETLGLSGVGAKQLVLVLSDIHVLLHDEEAIGNIRFLQELGVEMAIDHIESEALSFHDYEQITLDYMIVGGTLINQVAMKAKGMKSLEQVVSVAHRMGAVLIAKSVSQEEEISFLQEMGFRYFGVGENQGYEEMRGYIEEK